MVNFIIAYCVLSLIISLFFFERIAWSVGGVVLNQEPVLVKDILYLIFFPASYAICLMLLITFYCIDTITEKINIPDLNILKILNKEIIKRK